MRRTLDRSHRAKQKTNRWSWGGSLQPSTPSAAAGTFTSHGCFPVAVDRHIVLLSDPPALIVTADPALPLHLFLPSTFCSWTSSLLHHCALPSWSRFCRVGFPLSTRPCWTGAHAECFQSLPQIRNDLPM